MKSSVHARVDATVDALEKLDFALCRQLHKASRYRPLKGLFAGISRLGDGGFWYGLMGLLLAVDGYAALWPVLHMIAAGLVSLAFYKWLKAKTTRLRPCHHLHDVESTVAPLDHYSFPSGHTLHAVAFSWVATHYYSGLGWVVWPFTLLVALSRPITGLHYPSDVLAGGAIGAAIAAASVALATLYLGVPIK